MEHYNKVFHAQELGSYSQGQGSLAVFKDTARDQGHYKGPSGHLLHTVTFLVVTATMIELMLLFKLCMMFVIKNTTWRMICSAKEANWQMT